MKVLLPSIFEEEYRKEIESLGFTVSIHKYDHSESIKEEDYDANVIIGRREVIGLDLDKFKNLEYIFLITTGVDYIDIEKYVSRGIKVCNNYGAYDTPIAEWVLYFLLNIEKKDRENLRNQENKKFAFRNTSGEILGKKALILGTGEIAKATAKRLKGFDTEVYGYNTNGRSVEGFDKVFSKDELLGALKDMDYVISTLPSTEKTYHLVGKEFIENMKDGSVIVNISRGKVIDEEEMIKALQSGKLRGAGLDVFEVEPLPESSPLWEMENVYITAHISWSAENQNYRMMIAPLENLRRLSNGEELLNVISLEKGY